MGHPGSNRISAIEVLVLADILAGLRAWTATGLRVC